MQTTHQNSRKIKSCIFCKRSPPEVKITREHVLRAKFDKLLPGCIATILTQQSHDQSTAIETVRQRRIPQSSYNFTVNDVCKSCNEGWLNRDVEVAAEKFLFPLILGDEIAIPKSAADVLALWAAKTAMVRGLIDPKPHAVPPEHFSWIKDNLEPPPFTYVWLGRSEYAPYSWTRHKKMIFDLDGTYSRGHMTIIVIGHVAFYILGCGSEVGQDSLLETIADLDGHPIFQIWPLTNATHFNKLPDFSREKIYELGNISSDQITPVTKNHLQAFSD